MTRTLTDLNALSLPELLDELCSPEHLRALVDLSTREDFGDCGDITTDSIIPADQSAIANLVARDGGVVSGLALLPQLVRMFDDVECEIYAGDGDVCSTGSILAELRGSLRLILKLERTLLNFLGRLCGIATLTREYVDRVVDTNTVICETRKTTPGWRGLEKYAARCGGGHLHRVGLFDAALYKDNHLAGIALGDLADRLTEAIAELPVDRRFVEVEVDTLEQFAVLLTMEPGLVDIALLDNMSIDRLNQAVDMRDASSHDSLLLEASGGVTFDTVRDIAETGVDRISVGALTHSATSLDIGLDMQ